MSATPCVFSVNNCPCPESPLGNYTSEGPSQVPTFISVMYPDGWNKQGCISLCESEISQDDANLCALAQAAACNPPNTFRFVGNDFDGDDDGGDDGGSTFPVLFSSSEQE